MPNTYPEILRITVMIPISPNIGNTLYQAETFHLVKWLLYHSFKFLNRCCYAMHQYLCQIKSKVLVKLLDANIVVIYAC